MDCYNVKVINYLNSSQIRVYSNIIGMKELAKLYKFDDSIQSFDTNNEKFEYVFNEQIELENYLEDENNNNIKRVKAEERSLYSSKNRTINSIYEIARSNNWEYFLTLTFDPQKVDSFNYDIVTKKLTVWINNFKKNYAPDLKYILVPELHKSGRYHFHGLLCDIGNAKLINSGKVDNGNIIYNLDNYKLGFSTVTRINNLEKTCSYIGKYITKELCAASFGKKRYWCSRNLSKPITNTYVMSQDEILNMLDSISGNIIFSKNVDCKNYDLRTTYYELDSEFGGIYG